MRTKGEKGITKNFFELSRGDVFIGYDGPCMVVATNYDLDPKDVLPDNLCVNLRTGIVFHFESSDIEVEYKPSACIDLGDD
jgi:hypothetical protein